MVPSGTLADLRRANRNHVLRLLMYQGPLSRVELSEATGLTGAGISRISRELIDAGLIIEDTPTPKKSGVGRRQAPLRIASTGGYVLGITITVNRKSVALADARGKIISHAEMNDLSVEEPDVTIDALVAKAKRLILQSQIHQERIVGVGISLAVPEPVGAASEELISSHLLGWLAIPVARLFRERLNLPVKVEHRATGMLRAALRQGRAGERQEVFFINSVVGIGASAYLGGRFLSLGSFGFGDFSHVAVPNNTVQCVCGRYGCMDAVGSGSAVLDQLHGWRPKTRPHAANLNHALSEAIERANSGDKAVKKAFRHAGRMMGRGIDTVAALMGPRRIILAGETGRQPDYFAGLKDTIAECRTDRLGVSIECSKINSIEASVCIALDAFMYSPELEFDKLMASFESAV